MDLKVLRSDGANRLRIAKETVGKIRKEVWLYGASADMRQILSSLEDAYDNLIHSEIAFERENVERERQEGILAITKIRGKDDGRTGRRDRKQSGPESGS